MEPCISRWVVEHGKQPSRLLSEPIALVVDDERLILMDTSDIIRDAGYDVVEASSADDAIAFLEKHGLLQLLFTDVQTGGRLDGLDLARKVAERWPEGGAALRDREILCTVVEAGRVVIFDIVVTPGSKTADGLQVFASDRPVFGTASKSYSAL